MSNAHQPDNLTALVNDLVLALVDDPEQVFVEAIHNGDKTTLRLQVAASDIGKVIGKQGRTARSLRTILAAAAMKQNRSFALDIVECDDSR